jgi:hypothetical protein
MPERVFDLSTGPMAENRVVLAVISAAGMVLCFAAAAPLLVCGIKPFGKHPPPPAQCFSGVFLLTVAGLALAYALYYLTVASRRGAGSYHLFRDPLVVVGPRQKVRQMAWERIGPEKATGRLDQRHVYPVDGEADLDFDIRCADHLALDPDPDPGRGFGVGGRPAPTFLAHDPGDGGLHRVSPLAGRLLFLRVTNGCATGTRGFAARNVPSQPGVTGRLVAYAHMKGIERVQQMLGELEGADERRLFELAGGYRGSRLIDPEELADLHITPATSKEKRSTGVLVVAVLRFTHAEWGERKMYFESRQQLAEAGLLFKELLGRDFGHELASAAARA